MGHVHMDFESLSALLKLLNQIRRQVLERMGQSKKRNSQDEGEWAVKETRKRRSGNDAVEFLKAKCDKEMVLRDREGN